MSRVVPAAILTAFQQGVVDFVLYVEAEFDSGDVFLWSGIGERTIGAKTYQGAGNLLGLSETVETSNVESRGQTVTLSGIDATLISLALTEQFQGRPFTSLIGLMDSDDQMVLFSGKMNTMQVEDTPTSSTIGLAIENDMEMLDRVVQRYYTSASQKSRFPDDRAFDFVTSLGNQNLPWGKGR